MPSINSANPTVKTLPPMRLAYLRHTGPFGGPGIRQTWKRFSGWCSAAGLSTPPRQTYGIAQDDPGQVPPEKLRYDCCVEVDAAFKPTGEAQVQDFPGGRYACVDFYGTPADMPGEWMRLYSQVLPQAGLEPAPGPAVEVYAPDFEMDAQTGAFGCVLAAPVKA